MPHTPGPWVYDDDFGDRQFVKSTKDYYISICRMDNKEESEANAKLISSAPELLATNTENLKFLEWIASQQHDFNLWSDKRQLLYQIIADTKSAIKKATI